MKIQKEEKLESLDEYNLIKDNSDVILAEQFAIACQETSIYIDVVSIYVDIVSMYIDIVSKIYSNFLV